MSFQNKQNKRLLRIRRLLETTAFFSVSFLFGAGLMAQNLIPYGHFEGDTKEVLAYWKQPAGEYFHFQIGANKFIEAHSGTACNGVCIIGGAPSEYLQVALKAPLIAGTAYEMSFYVRGYVLRFINPERLDSIGVWFAKQAQHIQSRTELIETPQLSFQFSIEDSLETWRKVSFNYTASGGETHLVLGRFLNMSVEDKEALETMKQELESLSETFYQETKQANIPTGSLVYPGKKQSRKARKKEEKILNQQLKKYQQYQTEKRAITQKMIGLSQAYGAGANQQTYQVRLYFDDFCLVKKGDQCTVINQLLADSSLVKQATSFTSKNFNVGDTITLNHVYFDFDQSTLQPASYAELNILLDVLNNYPNMEISIEGHTDDRGDDAYNLELSTARADRVMNYLIDAGILANRLSIKGFGENKPKTTNFTDAGRAINRRVEIVILKK